MKRNRTRTHRSHRSEIIPAHRKVHAPRDRVFGFDTACRRDLGSDADFDF